MKKRIALAIAIAMVIGVISYGSQNRTLATSSDELQDEQDRVNEELEKLRGELGNVNSEIYEISGDMTDLEYQISVTEKEIEVLNLRLEETQASVDRQYEYMKTRIQYMYENSLEQSWNYVLASANFSEMLNRLEYIQQITTRDHQLMEEYKATIEAVNICKQDLEEKKAELESQHGELKNKQDSLLNSVENLNSDIQKNEELSEDLQKQIQAMKEYEEAQKRKKAQQLKAATEAQKKQQAEMAQQIENELGEKPSRAITPQEGELDLLAAIIYCEGGAESYEFQVAVGTVVINRVVSSYYPNTITEVISQNSQFSPFASGRLALTLENGWATPSCYQAAAQVIAGNVTGDWTGFIYDDGREGYVIGNVVFFVQPGIL